MADLAIPAVNNPRQALGAHVTGVLNGFFLILRGLCWERLRLAGRAATAVYGLGLYATYANWTINLLGSIFGTGKLTPLVASGCVGELWEEAIVNTGAVTLALASLVLILRSLRKPAGAAAEAAARDLPA